MYRHLDMEQIARTAEQLRRRIAERFPDSGLKQVAAEILSLTAKLAAVYAQSLDDPIILNAVNDVETLTGTLSAKIWQKIDIMDKVLLRREQAERKGMGEAA